LDDRFAVSFSGTVSGMTEEPMEMLRTMRAREEQRAVARRTGAGGGITGR
jgi:hypothetical protein